LRDQILTLENCGQGNCVDVYARELITALKERCVVIPRALNVDENPEDLGVYHIVLEVIWPGFDDSKRAFIENCGISLLSQLFKAGFTDFDSPNKYGDTPLIICARQSYF
jgi:hypothetical protein